MAATIVVLVVWVILGTFAVPLFAVAVLLFHARRTAQRYPPTARSIVRFFAQPSQTFLELIDTFVVLHPFVLKFRRSIY
jgi:hypothetical protein